MNTQRDIKFRAWDKKLNRMYYVRSIKDIGMLGSTVNYLSPDIKGVPIDFNCILLQFTGLLDKNGKEVYEGDIVKGVVRAPQLLTGDTDENCNTNMGGIVFWNFCMYSMQVIESLCEKEREGMINYFDFMMDYQGDFEEIEVIGNIYQNPELLK